MGVKGWGRHGALVTAWSVGKGRVGHWEQFVVGSSGGAVARAVQGVAEDLGKHRLGCHLCAWEATEQILHEGTSRCLWGAEVT